MSNAVFVLNAGSSSLKFRIFSANKKLELLADGRIIGIGSSPEFIINGKTISRLPKSTKQSDALAAILDWLKSNSEWDIKIIGHRIVHGGEDYTTPVELKPAILKNLAKLNPLAPLHQPHALSAVNTLIKLFPAAKQIGCFDTAFHSRHSEIFRHYALPKDLRDKGIRRYGFHGLSYEWIAHSIKTNYPKLYNGKIVAAHLGNGASLCAIKKGKSIDTTMGMTALDGLPMGTRCGSIDPGVTLYMIRELGMDGEKIDRILSYESGLKALSGISGDMRELSSSKTPEAKFAIDYFAMMTAQHVARMAVAISGLDTLVFTGGIGEHHSKVRNKIIGHLKFMPSFKTLVIRADEERMIAGHCLKFL